MSLSGVFLPSPTSRCNSVHHQVHHGGEPWLGAHAQRWLPPSPSSPEFALAAVVTSGNFLTKVQNKIRVPTFSDSSFSKNCFWHFFLCLSEWGGDTCMRPLSVGVAGLRCKSKNELCTNGKGRHVWNVWIISWGFVYSVFLFISSIIYLFVCLIVFSFFSFFCLLLCSRSVIYSHPHIYSLCLSVSLSFTHKRINTLVSIIRTACIFIECVRT